MTRGPGRAARLAAAAALAAAYGVLLAGCGASPAPLGPTGTDELVIPTPSPDPADFPGGASNAWFPLTPGTHWVYRQYSPYGNRLVDARVLEDRRRIEGVDTTAVEWTVREHGSARRAMLRWYAVDRAGNVWWFGQEVSRHHDVLDRLAPKSWMAGRDGAEAGLVLSAHPREGDGYFNAQQPRVVQRRSTVQTLDGTVGTTDHTYRHVVVTDDRSTLAPLDAVQSSYGRGEGLVAQQDTRATSTSLALVRISRG